jgi:hypothetical protein
MTTYLYGVTDSGIELDPDLQGVEGNPVRIATDRDLAAIVSPCQGDWVDASRANLSAHSHVVEQAMSHATVLPVRFGILFQDRRSVVDQLLRRHRTELSRLLGQLGGRAEFRVQVRYLPDVVVREAAVQDPAIRRLQGRLRGRPADATYYDRIRLGEKVVEIVEAIRDRDARDLLATIAAGAAEHRVLPQRSETVVLSAAFLVEDRRRDRFDRVINQLAGQHDQRMTFRVVGPLPPWDFADFDLGEVAG